MLEPQQILDAAEAVIRRHGPTKATVVDVAAELGMSHGSLYRHFPSKAALRDAVVQRWLGRVSGALVPLAEAAGDPTACLRAWFDELRRLKRAQLAAEPELFEAFRVLAGESRDVLAAYKAELERQVAALLERGMAAGAFFPADPRTTAQALLTATLRFYHPGFADQWSNPDAGQNFESLWAILARGITRHAQEPA